MNRDICSVCELMGDGVCDCPGSALGTFNLERCMDAARSKEWGELTKELARYQQSDRPVDPLLTMLLQDGQYVHAHTVLRMCCISSHFNPVHIAGIFPPRQGDALDGLVTCVLHASRNSSPAARADLLVRCLKAGYVRAVMAYISLQPGDGTLATYNPPSRPFSDDQLSLIYVAVTDTQHMDLFHYVYAGLPYTWSRSVHVIWACVMRQTVSDEYLAALYTTVMRQMPLGASISTAWMWVFWTHHIGGAMCKAAVAPAFLEGGVCYGMTLEAALRALEERRISQVVIPEVLDGLFPDSLLPTLLARAANPGQVLWVDLACSVLKRGVVHPTLDDLNLARQVSITLADVIVSGRVLLDDMRTADASQEDFDGYFAYLATRYRSHDHQLLEFVLDPATKPTAARVVALVDNVQLGVLSSLVGHPLWGGLAVNAHSNDDNDSTLVRALWRGDMEAAREIIGHPVFDPKYHQHAIAMIFELESTELLQLFLDRGLHDVNDFSLAALFMDPSFGILPTSGCFIAFVAACRPNLVGMQAADIAPLGAGAIRTMMQCLPPGSNPLCAVDGFATEVALSAFLGRGGDGDIVDSGAEVIVTLVEHHFAGRIKLDLDAICALTMRHFTLDGGADFTDESDLHGQHVAAVIHELLRIPRVFPRDVSTTDQATAAVAAMREAMGRNVDVEEDGAARIGSVRGAVVEILAVPGIDAVPCTARIVAQLLLGSDGTERSMTLCLSWLVMHTARVPGAWDWLEHFYPASGLRRTMTHFVGQCERINAGEHGLPMGFDYVFANSDQPGNGTVEPAFTLLEALRKPKNHAAIESALTAYPGVSIGGSRAGALALDLMGPGGIFAVETLQLRRYICRVRRLRLILHDVPAEETKVKRVRRPRDARRASARLHGVLRTEEPAAKTLHIPEEIIKYVVQFMDPEDMALFSI